MASQVTIVDAQQKFKKTPAGQIPVDWDFVSLGSVSTQSEERFSPTASEERPYVGLEHIGSGTGRLLGFGKSSSVSSLKTVFCRGDILFGKLRPNLRKVAIAPFDGVCSTDIIVVRPTEDIFRDFLFYRLLSQEAFDFAIGTSAGTKMPRTTWHLLRNYTFPQPPLDEQKKIAEILSSVDEAIERTTGAIEAAQNLRLALVKVLLSVGTDQKKVRQTPIGRLPEDWKLAPCADLCEAVTVGIVVKPARLYAASGIPCLRSLNIRENQIVEDDLVYISPDANEAHAKSKLKAGDVVAVRTGYPGTSCVIPEHLAGSNCVDLIILRPGPRINSSFLSQFINSPAGRRQVLRGQGGLAQQHFNVSEAAKLLVPVPPMEEQVRIVSVLESTDAIISKEAALRTRYASLRKGLMASLLTGKVRV